jgi:hypothetical protein
MRSHGSRSPGIKRRASSFNQPRLDAILATHPRAKNLSLHYGAPPSLPPPLPSRCAAAVGDSARLGARPRAQPPAATPGMRMQLLTRRADVARGAGDMSDASALAMLMRETKPDEVYNLAAQSHVAVSFVMPKCVRAGGTRWASGAGLAGRGLGRG